MDKHGKKNTAGSQVYPKGKAGKNKKRNESNNLKMTYSKQKGRNDDGCNPGIPLFQTEKDKTLKKQFFGNCRDKRNANYIG